MKISKTARVHSPVTLLPPDVNVRKSSRYSEWLLMYNLYAACIYRITDISSWGNNFQLNIGYRYEEWARRKTSTKYIFVTLAQYVQHFLSGKNVGSS